MYPYDPGYCSPSSLTDTMHLVSLSQPVSAPRFTYRGWVYANPYLYINTDPSDPCDDNLYLYDCGEHLWIVRKTAQGKLLIQSDLNDMNLLANGQRPLSWSLSDTHVVCLFPGRLMVHDLQEALVTYDISLEDPCERTELFVQFLADGAPARILTFDPSRNVHRLYDLMRNVVLLVRHRTPLRCHAVSFATDRILAVSVDGVEHDVSLVDGMAISRFPPYREVAGVCFHDATSTLVKCLSDGTVMVFPSEQPFGNPLFFFVLPSTGIIRTVLSGRNALVFCSDYWIGILRSEELLVTSQNPPETRNTIIPKALEACC